MNLHGADLYTSDVGYAHRDDTDDQKLLDSDEIYH